MNMNLLNRKLALARYRLGVQHIVGLVIFARMGVVNLIMTEIIIVEIVILMNVMQ